MATVLCVWEQGSNLGHLSNLRLPIEMALRRGHQVVVAARELHNIPKVLGDLPLRYLQAPFRQSRGVMDMAPFPSFTHLLARQCFSNVDELAMYLHAWRSIFDLVRPDLVLFEHSPTALIAARGYGFKKVVVGSGFTVPPALPPAAAGVLPFAPFAPFPGTSARPEVLRGLLHDDAEVLKLIHQAQQLVGAPPLASMHAIYAQADARLLMTWPILDHFGARAGETYVGFEPAQPRAPAQWPSGAGPKVFGYLQPFAALELLLQDLRAAQVCTLLYIRNLPDELRQKYAGPQLQFADAPVDLNSVAEQAAWVINHGNHSTAGHFLACGVPQLLIPLFQEQLLLAQNLSHPGAAILAFQDQPGFAQAVSELTTQSRYRQQAGVLATQCGPRDTTQLANALERVFALLTTVTM